PPGLRRLPSSPRAAPELAPLELRAGADVPPRGRKMSGKNGSDPPSAPKPVPASAVDEMLRMVATIQKTLEKLIDAQTENQRLTRVELRKVSADLGALSIRVDGLGEKL